MTPGVTPIALSFSTGRFVPAEKRGERGGAVPFRRESAHPRVPEAALCAVSPGAQTVVTRPGPSSLAPLPERGVVPVRSCRTRTLTALGKAGVPGPPSRPLALLRNLRRVDPSLVRAMGPPARPGQHHQNRLLAAASPRLSCPIGSNSPLVGFHQLIPDIKINLRPLRATHGSGSCAGRSCRVWAMTKDSWKNKHQAKKIILTLSSERNAGVLSCCR